MLIRVNAASERPIYAQIADAVRRAISRAEIGAGEVLPAARHIATSLQVNQHTVLRAYQELRDEGLIDLRRGRGAVVTSLAIGIVELRREAEELATRAAALGVGPGTLTAIVSDALEVAGWEQQSGDRRAAEAQDQDRHTHATKAGAAAQDRIRREADDLHQLAGNPVTPTTPGEVHP